MKRAYEIVKSIREDNLSGATILARKAAEGFTVFSQEVGVRTPEAYWEELVKYGISLIRAQPRMAPIFNLVNTILWEIKERMRMGGSVPELKALTKSRAENHSGESIRALEKLASRGQSLIKTGDKVMTYSFSRSVLQILLKARENSKRFQVIVPESRPMLEGRLMARRLSEEGIPCILIVDAAIGKLLKRSTLVLVGADSLCEEHFSNKIGTRALALLSREESRPFYLACEKSKFIPAGCLPQIEEEHDSREVLREEWPGVKVENPYFEQIPLRMTTGIITEDGILEPEAVCNLEVKICEDLLPLKN